MDKNPLRKSNTQTYRIWEANVRFYSVKGRKKTFSFRKLKAAILKMLNIRTTRCLGNEGLSCNQLAAFQSGASSQIQKILNTVDIGSYEGYTYGMEVSMIVTDIAGGNRSEIPVSRVFCRDFKSLVMNRGLLERDQSWILLACDKVRKLKEGE